MKIITVAEFIEMLNELPPSCELFEDSDIIVPAFSCVFDGMKGSGKSFRVKYIKDSVQEKFKRYFSVKYIWIGDLDQFGSQIRLKPEGDGTPTWSLETEVIDALRRTRPLMIGGGASVQLKDFDFIFLIKRSYATWRSFLKGRMDDKSVPSNKASEKKTLDTVDPNMYDEWYENRIAALNHKNLILLETDDQVNEVTNAIVNFIVKNLSKIDSATDVALN